MEAEAPGAATGGGGGGGDVVDFSVVVAGCVGGRGGGRWKSGEPRRNGRRRAGEDVGRRRDLPPEHGVE